MFKVELYFSRLCLIFWILLTACAASSQPKIAGQDPPKVEISTKSQKPESQKPESQKSESRKTLARKILAEIGIAQRYDIYLNNSIDITIPASTNNEKLRTWLQKVLVQEAGWKHVEDQYISQLDSSFSETELTELLNQSQHPLMKKLLQSEIQAYAQASKKRRKLLDKVWNDYNSGKITLPPEVLQ